MGKKEKVSDKNPTTTTDMGMFGSTTTGPTGSTFNATDFQKNFTKANEENALNYQNALNNLVTTDISRDIAQEAVDDMNRQYQLDFQNQLLSPALSKGWLRGSTAQDVATVANQDYQNRRYQLVNDEIERQQQEQSYNINKYNQALQQALGGYMTMYDIAKGVTGLSNQLNSNIANFQLQAQKANQESADARYKANMQAVGKALEAAGTVGAVALSDIRVKENIEKLDTVDGINIYKFDYINGAKDQVGVIAQEMQEKCPECVVNGEILKVDYSKLPEKVQARIEELLGVLDRNNGGV